MNKFTKFTALAVAALVMASTSAMAINLTSALENSRGSETINNTTIAGTPGFAGGTIGTTSTGGTSRFVTGLNDVSNGVNAVGTGVTGITNTAAAFANFAGTTANAVGAGTANGNGLSGAPAMSRFYNVDTSLSEAGYVNGRLAGINDGYRTMIASRGSGGGLGGLGGLAGGIGGLGGLANAGGAVGGLANLSGGLSQLGYNLNTIGNLVGVNLGGRTLMQAGAITGTGALLAEGTALRNLGNGLTGSVNQLGAGFNQSLAQFEAAGSALNRRNTIPTPTPSPNITQINNGIVEYE